MAAANEPPPAPTGSPTPRRRAARVAGLELRRRRCPAASLLLEVPPSAAATGRGRGGGRGRRAGAAVARLGARRGLARRRARRARPRSLCGTRDQDDASSRPPSGPRGTVTAVEQDEASRAAELERALRAGRRRQRRGPSSATGRRLDIGAGYDRVLVDAPCTGLGTLASRPDARWRRRGADVAELVDAAGGAARRAASRRCAPAAAPSTRSARSRAREGEAVVERRARAPRRAEPGRPRRSRPGGLREPLATAASCRRCPAATAATASSSPRSRAERGDERRADRGGPASALPAPAAASPGCGRPSCPGRFRCVNCLQRYELVSQCPGCGVHQTIARMRTDSDLRCQSCGESMLRLV